MATESSARLRPACEPPRGSPCSSPWGSPRGSSIICSIATSIECRIRRCARLPAACLSAQPRLRMLGTRPTTGLHVLETSHCLVADGALRNHPRHGHDGRSADAEPNDREGGRALLVYDPDARPDRG